MFLAIALAGFVCLFIDRATVTTTPDVAKFVVPAEGLIFAIWGVLARRRGRRWPKVVAGYGVFLLVLSALVAAFLTGLLPEPSADVKWVLLDVVIPSALGIPTPLAVLLWANERDRSRLLASVLLIIAPLAFCSSCGTSWIGGKYMASRGTAAHLQTFARSIPLPPGSPVVAEDNTEKLSDMIYVMSLPPIYKVAFGSNDDPDLVLEWYRTLWQGSHEWLLKSPATGKLFTVSAWSPPPDEFDVTVSPIWPPDVSLRLGHEYSDAALRAAGYRYGYEIEVRCSRPLVQNRSQGSGRTGACN